MHNYYSHLDLDTEDTLPEHDVSDGVVNVVNGGLTGVDDEAISELHGLCTGSTELAGDDNFAALRARLHDEAKHTIAGTTDSETSEQFVPKRLALCNGGQTTVQNLLSVELERVLGIFEPLLNERGKLTDATTLLS